MVRKLPIDQHVHQVRIKLFNLLLYSLYYSTLKHVTSCRVVFNAVGSGFNLQVFRGDINQALLLLI